MEDGNRWENPLIGWASSSDYQQSLAMKFWSKEAAIGFAEKQGKHPSKSKSKSRAVM